MNIEIKSRTGSSLFSLETETIKTALEAAVKSGADLRGADLRGAYLRGAYLRSANLEDAYLRGADLRGADLTGAYLRGVDLTGAYLRGAHLAGADLRGADLEAIRDDLFAVLSTAPLEVPGLISALKDGRVDGSTYEGACVCLVGTLEKQARTLNRPCPRLLIRNPSRPIEKFFCAIKAGDTPDTNQISRLVTAWAEEWFTTMQDAFGTNQTKSRE